MVDHDLPDCVINAKWELCKESKKRNIEFLDKNNITCLMIKEISFKQDNIIDRYKKIMSESIKKAENEVELCINSFDLTIDRLNNKHQQITELAKKQSGSVRDSAEKLAQGLLRIEKVANFNNLERYCELLESRQKP
jgi:CRISPR/Cas system CMR-associated protein Cmr5 small subunit